MTATTVQSTIRSADGVELQIHTVGSGPGVVIIHGGGVTSRDYRRLADALAGKFTVHSYDRRGHGSAPRLEPDWDLSVEVADLRAITAATGAARLFGHSFGACIALQAALVIPLHSVAVYDPPVPVDGMFPIDFLEPFGRAVDADDLPTAMAYMGRSVNQSRLPLGVLKVLGRGFLATPIGRRMGALMPTTLRQLRALAATAGPASTYSGIQARALLTSGTRSPDYYVSICDRLAAAVRNGRSARVTGSHNAANIARASFVRPFAEFFAEPDSTTV